MVYRSRLIGAGLFVDFQRRAKLAFGDVLFLGDGFASAAPWRLLPALQLGGHVDLQADLGMIATACLAGNPCPLSHRDPDRHRQRRATPPLRQPRLLDALRQRRHTPPVVHPQHLRQPRPRRPPLPSAPATSVSGCPSARTVPAGGWEQVITEDVQRWMAWPLARYSQASACIRVPGPAVLHVVVRRGRAAP